MSRHEKRTDQRPASPTRGGATLASLVAAQRHEELARLVENRSRITLASATGRGDDGPQARRTSGATLPASARGAASRVVVALRPRLARLLDVHAARADARARTAPSGPDSQLVCCA